MARVMLNENIKVSLTIQKPCKWYDRDDLEFPLKIKQIQITDSSYEYYLLPMYEIDNQSMLNNMKNCNHLCIDLDDFEIVK